MVRSGLSAAAGFAILAILAPCDSVEARKKRFTNWEKITNERYSFRIAYPGNVFAKDSGRRSEEGRVIVSRDGKSKLIVGTFENDSATTLDEYRRQLLTENYPGADIDFAPRKRKWFIISGTQGKVHFYEKVSFTCGGRLINSWALYYPVNERRYWDRVVEAIAPTYSPGAGRTGRCD